MCQYNSLSRKLYYSQLNKLQSGIKNGTEVPLNLSSNVICGSNDGTSFTDINCNWPIEKL